MRVHVDNISGDFRVVADAGEDIQDLAAAVLLSSYFDCSHVGINRLRLQGYGSKITKEVMLKLLDVENNIVYLDYIFDFKCTTRLEVKDDEIVGNISPERLPIGILSYSQNFVEKLKDFEITVTGV